MKNSEMKTIIRHIDRLTRNLNVKGRRRDADNDWSRKQIESARETIKARCRLNAKYLRELVEDCMSGGIFEIEANKEDFTSVKKLCQSVIRTHIPEIVERFKTIMKECDEGIKAQKGSQSETSTRKIRQLIR